MGSRQRQGRTRQAPLVQADKKARLSRSPTPAGPPGGSPCGCSPGRVHGRQQGASIRRRDVWERSQPQQGRPSINTAIIKAGSGTHHSQGPRAGGLSSHTELRPEPGAQDLGSTRQSWGSLHWPAGPCGGGRGPAYPPGRRGWSSPWQTRQAAGPCPARCAHSGPGRGRGSRAAARGSGPGTRLPRTESVTASIPTPGCQGVLPHRALPPSTSM